jgi:hypothetical protein
MRITPKYALLTAIVLSSAAKLLLSTKGHNYDLESFQIVSQLVMQGKSVYANTDRYNYGPVWALILGGLGMLCQVTHVSFHAAVAGFLAAVDALIALMLARMYSHPAALFFILSPIGILLSGYHSQFDNLALLIALASWSMIRRGDARTSEVLLSALLAGLSLATKHFLVFFLIWIVCWNGLGSLMLRARYVTIACAVFLGSFLPWCWSPASRAGIVENVFAYRGTESVSLLGFLPFEDALTAIWIVLLGGIGFFLTRRNTRELFIFYLLAFYASSPAVADQYLVFSLLACAVAYCHWPSWVLLMMGTAALVCSPANVFALSSTMHPVLLVLTQLCAAILLAVIFRSEVKHGHDRHAGIQ